MYYWPNYIINSLLFASYSFKDSQTQTLNSFLMKYAQKSLDLIIYPLYSFSSFAPNFQMIKKKKSNKVKNKFEAARWLNGCMEFRECAPPISVLQHTTKNSGESEKSYPTIRHFCQGNFEVGQRYVVGLFKHQPSAADSNCQLCKYH